jgi:flagellar basal body rod protein FlgG
VPIINSASSEAMQSWQQALTITANNVANISTEGFQPQRPVFQETELGGVKVTAEPSGDSRVSFSEEAVRLSMSTRGSEANLKAIKAQDEATGTLLNLFG